MLPISSTKFYATNSDLRAIVDGADKIYAIGQVARIAYIEDGRIVVAEKPSATHFFRAIMERCFDHTNDSVCELFDVLVYNFDRHAYDHLPCKFFRNGAVELWNMQLHDWEQIN